MLTALSDILYDARKNGYGVPALAVENELSLHSAIRASEEAHAPLVLLSGYKKTEDLNFFIETLNFYCNMAKTPVAIVMDHSSTFEKAVSGIRAGFGTVMVDRSKLPFEKNAAEVGEIVRIAHACGIEVEAELGHVGGREYENGQDSGSVLTVVSEAQAFVEQTKVDFLAVAIGSAHGLYKGTPKLHFDLLQELRKEVSVPLVLHGASGTGDDNISKACQLGISKVNVGTELYMAARDSVQQADLSEAKVYAVYDVIQEAYAATAKRWFEVCGCNNRA